MAIETSRRTGINFRVAESGRTEVGFQPIEKLTLDVIPNNSGRQRDGKGIFETQKTRTNPFKGVGPFDLMD